MQPLLHAGDLSYHYNGKEVLSIDSLDIPEKSITGLYGPNGSGKTTLLKVLSGVHRPTTGSVWFRGVSLNRGDTKVRHQLCLLPQETCLLKRTVYANIAYGLKIRGEKGSSDQAVRSALDLVRLPGSFGRRQWHELSGGEAQRVALAARLVLKPACLMMDEPTASVDMESAVSIRQAVQLARQEWGTTLIISSHYRSWLEEICDQIIYICNGQIDRERVNHEKDF